MQLAQSTQEAIHQITVVSYGAWENVSIQHLIIAIVVVTSNVHLASY